MQPKYFDFRMFVLWLLFFIFILTFIKLGSQETLDGRFFYSGTEAFKFISSLNDKAVLHYLLTAFFDLGFILVYAALLFLNLKRVFYKVPRLKYFSLLPAGLDFFETKIVIESLLNNGRTLKDYDWVGYVTMFKWLTVGFLLALFLIKITKISYLKFTTSLPRD